MLKYHANGSPVIYFHRLVLLCIYAHCFIFWDLPGDVLAAPESALGLDRCHTSLSLSLSLYFNERPLRLSLINWPFSQTLSYR